MLDDTNLKIIRILQERARIPNVEIARIVGLAPSAVLERIRKMERKNIITGYEVKLNTEFFSRNFISFVLVEIRGGEDIDDIGYSLSGIKSVQEAYFISGKDCFLLKVRTKNHENLGKLIQDQIMKIEGVLKTTTNSVLLSYKETATLEFV